MVPRKKWNLLIFPIILCLLLLTNLEVEGLGISTNTIQFTNVTLDGNDQTINGSTLAWQVDATDSADGWNVVVSTTDFLNQSSKTISSTNLEIRLLDENITLISGTSGPVSSQTVFTPIGSGTIKIVSSGVGQGIGIYDIVPEFRLLIPAQTYAGIYTSTMTISIVSGP